MRIISIIKNSEYIQSEYQCQLIVITKSRHA